MARRLLPLLCAALLIYQFSMSARAELPSKSFISSLVSEFELGTAGTPAVAVEAHSQQFSIYQIANAIPLLQVYRDILAEHRVPPDFSLLPLIESANNPFAQSHKNAVGLWQFIPSTGAMHGLRIQSEVDDRRNVVRSTTAAAEHLAYLYAKLGDWVLVIAAYNCGLNCVVKAKKAAVTSQPQKIIQRTPLETREYVRKFLALRRFVIAHQHHSAVGRFPEGIYLQRVSMQSLHASGSRYSESLDASLPQTQVVRFLNIGLNKDLEPKGSVKALLPTSLFGQYFFETKVSFRQPKRLSGHIGCNIQTGSFYQVKVGESLHHVALKAKVSVDKLRELNGGIGSARPGMFLRTC